MDWAVHPALDRRPALDILDYFDRYESEFRRSGITIKEFDLQPLNEFLALQAFRTEFIAALQESAVSPTALENNEFWRSFVQHYLGVIQDCPLQAIVEDGRLVVEVTGQAWPHEAADSIFPGRRVIQWSWKPKDRATQSLICALV